MRGEVLHYDETQGFGFIAGTDGNRYTFERGDLRRQAPLSKGTAVEFRADGPQARDVFILHGTTVTVQPAQTSQFGRFPVAPAQPESTGMWSYFIRAVTSNYVNFRDRARRKEYWSFVLFWTLGGIVLVMIGLLGDQALGTLNDDVPALTFGIFGLYWLATILPGLAMCIRRQHDIGLSGWFYLLVLVPYVGSLIIFVFSLIPSQKHENKWGPVPAGIEPAQPYVPQTTGATATGPIATGPTASGTS